MTIFDTADKYFEALYQQVAKFTRTYNELACSTCEASPGTLNDRGEIITIGAYYVASLNALNYSLMNRRASLSISDRYGLDEKVFHELTYQALKVN